MILIVLRDGISYPVRCIVTADGTPDKHHPQIVQRFDFAPLIWFASGDDRALDVIAMSVRDSINDRFMSLLSLER
ncbi:hypothetical protein [Microcoleus sp. BROC3]|uniref:hypothetical protein n=1 Tax=Microcoleus sp. BROC3 TaxID=3055323 RepID=UPI002FD1475E